MTASDLLTTEELQREPVKEPARAWRIKWRCLQGCFCSLCWREMTPGDVFWDCCGQEYPSRDTAETAAQEMLARPEGSESARGTVADYLEFLGAFPSNDKT